MLKRPMLKRPMLKRWSDFRRQQREILRASNAPVRVEPDESAANSRADGAGDNRADDARDSSADPGSGPHEGPEQARPTGAAPREADSPRSGRMSMTPVEAAPKCRPVALPPRAHGVTEPHACGDVVPSPRKNVCAVASWRAANKLR